jgi:hypothetical protein
MSNSSGIRNIAIGDSSLMSNTSGNQNIAIGSQALTTNTSGLENIAIGDLALTSSVNSSFNIAVGGNSQQSCTDGFGNVAVGTNTLQANTLGQFNVAIGHFAGAQATGTANTLVNGGNLITTGNANIMIGNGGDAADSHIIRIGDSGNLKCFVGGIYGVTTDIGTTSPVLVSTDGQLGTTTSSQKFKHAIQMMTDESAKILELDPVSFIYNADKSQTRQFGLIAEEVDKVFPLLVIKDKNGEPYTVRYEVLPVLLLNEMKKLVDKVTTIDEEFTRKVATLEKALALVQEKLAEYTTHS